ncbi:phosphoinositide 3-kinase regulatory subunit 4-like [Babylonia areolata]|uniref:phosphoinositide 3-kinase regulatory subunit 4-like n=1 Tax=Babylonia areolata TaxID=304850 RepID=UPI003FD468D1
MGNQLTGVAPSQIYPVEHYLADNTEYEYESSLGSTRFFKVARAKCKEGLAVVKVFVIHDPSLPLERHRQRLEEIAVRLKTASNCLPFQKSVQLERSALLFRQYVKYSLYDRMSTRPFLISIEKRWIAFQLLCALNQCHKLKVCHGDIKSENVMLTSWNWVLLTDFASFKPAFLPEDNPSDFSYFFDSSRRRTCYIAPERFVESSVLNAEGDLNLTEEKTGELNAKMDIFSVGCVITELFTDGIAPFDLSQLLSYRRGEYSPWKVIDSIQGHAHIKELVSHMLQKDPEHRLSAEEYLVKQRGKAFPDVFYTSIKMYQQQYVDSIFPPDDKVLLLTRDLDQLMKSLQVREDKPEANDNVVLVVSLVGSVCRNLNFAHHRELALDLLYKLSRYLTVDLILNRIVPLILYFLSDTYAEVRGKAVRTLAAVLSPVTEVPESEANIFSEYIFPELSNIVTDEEVIVRLEYARNIAALAEAAFRVLESTHQLRLSEQEQQLAEQEEEENNVEEDDADDDESLQEFAEQSYDSELQALQETIQHKVVTLLSDANNTVKMTLIDNDIGRLCHFFGRQKASDVLLSHMITFLNDKQDWQLRASFFVAITSVASYVGWQSAQILKPLLQQGLSDTEEYVIQKTLSSLQKLVFFGFIHKSVLLEFVTDIAPLLAHPNKWIRQGSAGFISSVASVMDVADLHVKLLPQVKPFLSQPIIQLKNQIVLLSALGEPLPRPLYDWILRSQQVEQVYEMLRLRDMARTNKYRSLYTDDQDSMSQLLRKLQHLGMTENHEVKVLAMKDFILKVHRARAGSAETGNGDGEDQQKSGVINIRNLGYVITRRHADLHKTKDAVTEANAVTKTQKKKQQKAETPATTMNAEWRKMFGADDSDQSSLDSPVKGRQTALAEKAGDSADGKKSGPSPTPLQPHTPSVGGGNSSAPSSHQPLTMEPVPSLAVKPTKAVTSRFAQCKWDLRNCVHHQRSRFEAEVMSRDLVEGIMWESRLPPDNWRPKGVLVAHLQEHRAAVNRLCVSPDHKYFASCSNDSTVRLWEVSRLEGKTAANRSQLVFNKQSGAIKCLTFCGSSHMLAAASDLGSLNVYQLDSGGGAVKHTVDYDKENKGPIMDLAYFDTGAQSMLTFATVHGYIVGWDLRCRQPAWVLNHDIGRGVITALAVHQTQSWMAVGTSVGTHNVWDLRFMLPIVAPTIKHRAKRRVRRIVMHPQKQSWFASAVEWNNEVSMWNVESMMRQEMLWASPFPPFTEMENSGHSVRGLYLASTDTHTFALTGGTDKCIRYWDLKCPAKSFIMSHGCDYPSSVVSYRSQLIDGCEVTQEMKTNQVLSQRDREDTPSRMSFHDAPPTGHMDAISDITLCQASQCLVVSASYNGHIKVWK